MAMADQPAGKSFRLSMLLYDTRYRAITIQVIMLALCALGVWWLLDNMYANLAKIDKDPDFTFLSSPAGYDINQRLIEYTSQSSNYRAWLVGLLNTLLVAFLGCILATVLGVLIGVLRLSKNWVISRLMTVYIETFRNVPVLLWIIFAMTIFIEILPEPKEFRGADAEYSLILSDSIAVTNRGILLPRPVFIGTEEHFEELTAAVAAISSSAQSDAESLLEDIEAGHVNSALIDQARKLVQDDYTAMLELEAQVQGYNSPTISENDKNKLRNLIALQAKALNVEITDDETTIVYSPDQTTLAKFLHVIDAPSAIWKVLVIVFVGSIVVMIGFAKWAHKRQESTGQSLPVFWINLAILILPVIIAYVITGQQFGFDYPIFTGRGSIGPDGVERTRGIFRLEGGLLVRNSLIALWFALSLYTAAFIAEAVRAGIMAINKGQSEAAGALGLRPNRIMSLVVLPQALRVIIPPLISQYLNLTKNSSLAIAVGYMDVTGTLGGITLNQTGRALECILLLMITYLLISLSISLVMNVYNNSVKLQER